jgi:phage N-6-adenine-methyltransferase
MQTEVHFSSKLDDYGTPRHLYSRLDVDFRFDLDPCATSQNAKCERFYTESDDGLIQPWADRAVFMNPPYSRAYDWIRKAYEAVFSYRWDLQAKLVVCLIPARTDTQMWHEFCMRGEMKFIEGRLTFEGATDPAPFPSAIIVFQRNNSRAGRCFTFRQ